MRAKKWVVILSCFIISCTTAYLIGQFVVVPLTQKDDIQNNDEIIKYRFVDNFEDLSFEGKKDVDTSENPWGSTVAKIEVEDVGTSIMMSQGTGMSTKYHADGNESIQWNYSIHPWVSEYSDGMSLYIRVYADDKENARLRRSYIIKPDDEYISVSLSLSEFADEDITISFSVDNGGNGDSAGDWLVLNDLNIVSGGEEAVAQENNNDDYWVSAHYFADAWPANMWDSEFENIDKDFQQIKNDGFNSIILVVPWRQFQPEIDKTNTYNRDAFDKLDMIMSKADEYDLGVILRIGYTWDYYQNRGNDAIIERYENIVNDQQTRNAWLEYVERVYAVANVHESLWGGFICWEDFWNLTTKMKSISGRNEESMKYAENIGFSDYVLANYDISAIREMYDDEKIYSEEDLYVPTEDKKAFKVFYDFYDAFLNELLNDTQTTFPNLSMEVRVDDDWIVNEEGRNVYYSHEDTYICNGSDYSTIMYGIPIGFVNNGEKVSWKEAISKTSDILAKVNQGTEGKKIFIDQFLYYDNTQAYSHNAQLIEEQLDDYLMNAPKVLDKYTRGYGIWVYQDYYVDTIANGSFADELNGWENIQGDADVRKIDGNNKCLLVDGAEIEQDVTGKVTDTVGIITCKLDASLIEDEFVVKVRLNNEEKEILVKEDGTYFVEFDDEEWGKLSISVEGEGFIDNVKLYNFCQRGLIYDVDGNEEELVDTIRKLNVKLGAK